jgi:hypothetical protein
VFEKRMEAGIRRSFPERASGLLCHSQAFVLVRVVLRCNFYRYANRKKAKPLL